MSRQLGREGTRELLAQEYTWPSLTQDVRRFLRKLQHLRKIQSWRERKHRLLKPLPIPERIWTKYSIDFITGLAPRKVLWSLHVTPNYLVCCGQRCIV